VQLVSRIERVLSRTLSLKSLFDKPGLSDLALELMVSADYQQVAITHADRNQALPLSWSQRRLWFITQLDDQASLAYHMSASLRLTGELNLSALEQTLSTLLERHEVLRTTFAQNDAGEPVQVIQEGNVFALSHVDISDLDRTEQSKRLTQQQQLEAETRIISNDASYCIGWLVDGHFHTRDNRTV